MTIWTPTIDESGPVYLAITRALEADIALGRLVPGDRLPTHRDLAAELGVNVGTITRAYGEARRRGLIEGEVGRGTWVRTRPQSALSRVEPEAIADSVTDLSINVPHGMPSPDLARALAELAASGREHLESVMAYQDPAGSPALRRAGSKWLERLGLDVPPDRLVACAGAQHAILVALGAIAGPGDLVLGEALTYPGFLASARLLGLRVKGVAIDREGIVPESLEALCQKERPRLLYCMPSLQNPTCAQLSQPRRETIAEIAERHDLVLVQDEIHGGLIEDRPTSFAELVPHRTLTIASLSKTLSPGIRIAFLAGAPAWIPRLTELIWGSVWMSSPLGGELARRWIEDGTVDKILAARQNEISARQKIASRVLGDIPHVTRASAYHLWLPLVDPWDNASATAAIARAGVKISSADEFRAEPGPTSQAIRISLSATRDRERLEAGLTTIADVLLHERPPAVLA